MEEISGQENFNIQDFGYDQLKLISTIVKYIVSVQFEKCFDTPAFIR